MDLYLIATIITGILAILGILFGGKYKLKLKAFIKETKDMFQVINEALDDDKITKEELNKIIKEAEDILDVFKN